jgi:hypothetical protein
VVQAYLRRPSIRYELAGLEPAEGPGLRRPHGTSLVTQCVIRSDQEVNEMAERKTARRGYLRRLADQLDESAGRFMKSWRTQARRPDAVGDASYRSLELVHGGLGVVVRSLTRMEKATQPPHRAPNPEPPVPQHHAARPHAHAAEPPARRPRPTARPTAAHRAPREASAS